MINLPRRTLLSGAAMFGASCSISARAQLFPLRGIESPSVLRPPRGQQPIPQPYPLQPGFQPITSLDKITSPGNYQLMNDDVTGVWSITAPCIIDVGGHSITGISLLNKIVLRNANSTGTIFVGSPDCTIENCSVYGKTSLYVLISVTSGCNNVLIKNNTLDTSGDDCLVIYATLDSPAIGTRVISNYMHNAAEMAIEGAGGAWDGLVFDNNELNYHGAGIGGFTYPWNFSARNCIFKDTIGNQVRNLFYMGGPGANDDAGATAQWGSQGNVFTGTTCTDCGH